MWQFAVGVYFVRLSTDDRKLLLAAVYGFTGGGLVLLFGGVIGDWVDRNKRLKGQQNFLQ
jgi:solute carrier family 40 (iron-regulated transporter), member 1